MTAVEEQKQFLFPQFRIFTTGIDYLFRKGSRLFFIRLAGGFKIFDDAMPLNILTDILIRLRNRNVFAAAVRMDRQLRQPRIVDIEYFSVVVTALPASVLTGVGNI